MQLSYKKLLRLIIGLFFISTSILVANIRENKSEIHENFDLFSYDNKKLKAAGTLLYALNPKDNKVYVLLSKEMKWEGPSSEKWKGFGGRRDPGETLVQTAVRETLEESRGLIKLDLKKNQTKNYIFCEHYLCKYFQIMTRIPFDSSLPDNFQKAKGCSPYEMEKTEVRWVPLSSLIESIKEVDVLSTKNNCRPRLLSETIFINDEKEQLILAKDFIETMVIIYRENSSAFDQLLDSFPLPTGIR